MRDGLPGRIGQVPPRPEAGVSQVSNERTGGIDLASLPPNPAPPDMWQDQAACHGIDPDVFFPTSEEEAGPALTYCGACGIREMCLAWALKNGERYGVWGGLTEQQRRRLVRFVA
jgi:WhiB family redox-sensing transcriptional regulator